MEINEENLKDSISSSQIFQIRQQILAYKYVIKNLPIPKDIEKNLVQLNKDQWEIEKERILQRAIKFHKEKIEKNQEINEFLQFDLQKKVDENIEEYESFLTSKNEHINYLKNFQFEKFQKRLNYLSDLTNNSYFSEHTKNKNNNELKFLKIFELYSRTKENILSKIDKETEIPFKLFERIPFDSEFYSREKPSKKNEV